MSKFDYNFMSCSIKDVIITAISLDTRPEDFDLVFDYTV